MQSREDLEQWYTVPDPWGFETNPDDHNRKRRILDAIPGRFKRALDIGCGEGWVTKDLPAAVVHGFEWSEAARARIPKPVVAVDVPTGKYDLVLLTGVLYDQYDHGALVDLVHKHAAEGGVVLTCHIKDWERPLAGEAELVEEFPYRGEYVQVLRRFRWQ